MSLCSTDARELVTSFRQQQGVLAQLAQRRGAQAASPGLVAQIEALAGRAEAQGLLRFHRLAATGVDHAALARIGARRTRQAQLARRAAQAGAGRDGFGHH